MKSRLTITGVRPNLRLFFTCLYITIHLCSCSLPLVTSSNHYFPVRNRDKRASSLGFSIAPPSGSGWYEKLNDNSLYYLKNIESRDYSIYTKATEIHLDVSKLEADRFLQYVLGAKDLNKASGDYRNISFNYTYDKELSPLCIRYVQSYEDHGSNTLNLDEFVRVQKNGLVCMHPDIPGNGIDMFYVESVRHKQAKQKQSFKDEGESFLSSLQFHPSSG